jgi:hypothetical protein
MKIAVSTADGVRLSGHAGKARRWLVHEDGLPPRDLVLDADQLFHHWRGTPGTHPLEGMDLLVTASAGEGFVRRLERLGVRVVMTSERSIRHILRRIDAGETLPLAGFNPLGFICRIRDIFSSH